MQTATLSWVHSKPVLSAPRRPLSLSLSDKAHDKHWTLFAYLLPLVKASISKYFVRMTFSFSFFLLNQAWTAASDCFRFSSASTCQSQRDNRSKSVAEEPYSNGPTDLKVTKPPLQQISTWYHRKNVHSTDCLQLIKQLRVPSNPL